MCIRDRFFFQGTPAEGSRVFDRLWPEARAVSDESGWFYRAFGLERGGLAQILGPGVWIAGTRAAFKGHLPGKPVGDPRMMPGAFLVEGERVLWRHRYRHAGDHPDFARVGDPALSS